MSDRTHIEWTDASWNPIRARRQDGQPNKAGGGWACQRVSPGCQNCYAETINKRLGTGLGYDAGGMAGSELYLDEHALLEPLRWRAPRRVFACSMTDLFGSWVPDEWLDRIFAVMALARTHTFQVLTKRPERMRAYVQDMGEHYCGNVDGEYMERWGDAAESLTGDPCSAGAPIEDCGWPLPNVWLGVSVEDQARAEERIPLLIETPAAVRWLSLEPLLEAVSLCACDRFHSPECWLPKLDWAVIGGESGPGARPCGVGWIRSLVGQCQAAGVPVFVKQLGARPYTDLILSEGFLAEDPSGHMRLRSRKGGDMAEWPEDLRVREFPR